MSAKWIRGAIGIIVAALSARAGAADLIPTQKPKPRVVIELQVKPDPKAALEVGEGGATTAADKEQAAKLFGRHAADQILKQIDFEKQQAVRVVWSSGGPPFGAIANSVEETKDGLRIVFFVNEPNVQVRGRALKLGLDYFAVPKGAKVSFGK